jgi:DNA-binding IclR family transcriptional regulator
MSRVQAIERAFAVLAALGGGPTGVTAIAGQSRLPKSTVVRLLRALQREGAVEQLPGDGRYRLGPRVTTLAASVAVERSMPGLARPHLVELASITGEAAGLSVPDGRWMHYLVQIDTLNPIAVRDWTGTYIPMHAVSSG